MNEQIVNETLYDTDKGNLTPLLIAEDDVPLARFLRKGLQSEAYKVDLAHSGDLAYAAIAESKYQMLILDLNLPKLDGITLLTEVRKIRPHLNILVLTASNLEGRIRAINSGADDCILKPFSFFELTARLRALQRRSYSAAEGVLKVGDLELDSHALTVRRAGEPIDLTSTEFKLLEYLMKNKGRPLTRALLMERVWHLGFDASSNLVDVYIKYLRDKIDNDYPEKLIRTIRGIGYAIAEA